MRIFGRPHAQKRSDHPVARRGDTLACHVCKFEVAELTRDLYLGAMIEASLFKSKSNQSIKNGDPTNCPKCGADLFPQGMPLIVKENRKNAPLV